MQEYNSEIESKISLSRRSSRKGASRAILLASILVLPFALVHKNNILSFVQAAKDETRAEAAAANDINPFTSIPSQHANKQIQVTHSEIECSGPIRDQIKCSIQARNKNEAEKLSSICASDGRLYASKCDLNVQACLRNVSLETRSREFCKRKASRLVKLRNQCGPREFEQFKRLLLTTTSGDSLEGRVADLFRKLDTNQNRQLEAHELWPKVEPIEAAASESESESEPGSESTPESDQVVVVVNQDSHSSSTSAFIWNDAHSSVSRRAHQEQDGLAKSRVIRYAQLWSGVCPRHWAHCWRLLEFPFEPHFSGSSNPCSLSHLFLYATSKPRAAAKRSLDLNSFGKLFSLQSSSSTSELASSLIQSGQVTEETNKKNKLKLQQDRNSIEASMILTLELGESLSLSCNPTQAKVKGNAVVSHQLSSSPKAHSRAATVDNINYNDDSPDADPEYGDLGPTNQESDQSTSWRTSLDATTDNNNNNNQETTKPVSCWWSRHQAAPLESSIRGDPHVKLSSNGSQLLIRDAQLYNSGPYKCQCKMEPSNPDSNTIGEGGLLFEQNYILQVLASPRVEVEPAKQLSMLGSRAKFQCLYDFIDTRAGDFSSSDVTQTWNWTGDLNSGPSRVPIQRGAQLHSGGLFGISLDWSHMDLQGNKRLPSDDDSVASRYKLSTQSSGLTIEPVHQSDAGRHICQIRVPLAKATSGGDEMKSLLGGHNQEEATTLVSSDKEAAGRLCVISRGRSSLDEPTTEAEVEETRRVQGDQTGAEWEIEDASRVTSQATKLDQELEQEIGRVTFEESGESGCEKEPCQALNLWMFHENGISIYKLRQDDGSDGEMEIVREIDGHSMISGNVDGNWNQLTLCGGLTPEQAVICEWSDNAIALSDIDIEEEEEQDKAFAMNNKSDSDRRLNSEKEQEQAKQYHQIGNNERRTKKNNNRPKRRFVYVGQPNLNRIIVMDARVCEIVAIIQTEPQPRRLHLVKPNRVRLNKWIRRRFSPSRLAKIATTTEHKDQTTTTTTTTTTGNSDDSSRTRSQQSKHHFGNEQAASNRAGNLVNVNAQQQQLNNWIKQYDIWLLCYGQPLIVDPSGVSSEVLLGEAATSLQSAGYNNNSDDSDVSTRAESAPNKLTDWTFSWPQFLSVGSSNKSPLLAALTGHHSSTSSQHITSNDKESRLRNRKSVHIVQSTFLPVREAHHLHGHELDPESPNYKAEATLDQSSGKMIHDPVSEFRRSTLISTHHVFVGSQTTSTTIPNPNLNFQTPTNSNSNNNMNDGAQIRGSAQLPRIQDLIHDLTIPQRPKALEKYTKHKVHFAYVSHYNELRLFRVSMDDYRYEREIDLQNCDPLQLIPSSLGLIIIQCRSPISHELTGQMILDELTSTQIEFNPLIKAQDTYLSPDHRHLISVYTNPNQSSSSSGKQQNVPISTRHDNENDYKNENVVNSVIYVQTLTTTGAKFQYEIKTSTLDISECSFVWRDGYYAAIFVSTNHREQESEILSLRLADGRLELIARVPGIMGLHHRHREQLIVAAHVRLAALSTNLGTFIVDLEENRISQSLRQHQPTPTLLWV